MSHEGAETTEEQGTEHLGEQTQEGIEKSGVEAATGVEAGGEPHEQEQQEGEPDPADDGDDVPEPDDVPVAPDAEDLAPGADAEIYEGGPPTRAERAREASERLADQRAQEG